jgi:ribosome biogenesis GTPase
MVDGIIYKALSGFYYVKTTEGNLECKARGVFRIQKHTPLVGDYVEVELDQETALKGTIVKIKERSIEFKRPAVANVDQALIVFALKNPAPNMNLLDKLLVMCEHTGIEPILVFNKYDLDEKHFFDEMDQIYASSGYKLIKASTKVHGGTDSLKKVLKDKISVFCGPSGVGKSSILNTIQHGLKLKTGELSEKIQRGKHTTRHTELVALDFGGFVVDTPGFTSLAIDDIEMDEVKDCFPEFRKRAGACRFDDCLHMDEPGCEIIKALDAGEIHFSRYQSYKQFFYQKKEDRRNKSW